jgi:hypothetical protein
VNAKVMQLDGTSFYVKLPTPATDVLQDHLGFHPLEFEEVKHSGFLATALALARRVAPPR